MKVAILAGGFGTRLSEETGVKPKPMVEIGGRPILWHIMKFYSHFGLRDFVVLGGYKVEVIRDYFLNYRSRECDFTIDLQTGEIEWATVVAENWRVTVLDTGPESMTGGRLLRARHLLGDDTFCLTYGDGLCDVNLPDLLAAHRASGAWCTLTAVIQPGRYGALRISERGSIEGFREKGSHDGGLINGGYFVCEPAIFDLIDGDQTIFEEEPMTRLIDRSKLAAFTHAGYWQSMDSLRDRHVLEEQWRKGAPWKVWS
jgi:glucose-1-phosphate cytidylyltransferase